MSESISEALKPGEHIIWELTTPFLFKEWLYLNRFRLIRHYFSPVSLEWLYLWYLSYLFLVTHVTVKVTWRTAHYLAFYGI